MLVLRGKVRSVKRTVKVLAALALLVAPVLAPVSVSAAPLKLHVQITHLSDGTVIYNFPAYSVIEHPDHTFDYPGSLPSMTDMALKTIVGSKVGGHCNVPVVLHGTKGGPTRIAVERSFNPNTCATTYVEGNLTTRQLIYPLTTATISGGDPQSTAQETVSWYDPINLMISQLWVQITWNWDGTYVDSYTGGGNNYIYTTTGWQIDYQYYTPGGSTPASGDAYLGNAKDENDPFCTKLTGIPQPPTLIYYNGTSITGYGNGGYAGQANTSDSGGCAGLLKWSASTTG